MTDENPLRVEPVEWELRYAVEVDSIGIVRLEAGRYRLTTGDLRPEDRRVVGWFPDGDAAAVAGWRAYVALEHARHAAASTVHGSAERHPQTTKAPPRPAP